MSTSSEIATSAAPAIPPKPAARRPLLPRALRNVLANWCGYFFSILITFFVSPFVVHHLGDSAYGIWILLVSLTGYLGLLDLGVRGAVTRYVAKFHAQSNHKESGQIASAALSVFLLTGAVAVSIAIGAALFAPSVFHIPEQYRQITRAVFPLTGFTVAISLIGGVFGGILAALQRFDLLNTIEVTNSSVRSLVIVLVLRGGKGIVALAAIQLAFAATSALANYWTSHWLYPELRVHFGKADRERLRMIFSFSFYSFLLQITTYLILYTDAVVIGAFLPVSLVTFFSIAGNLAYYTRSLISGISQTMTPMASSLEASGKHTELQLATLNSARYATALAMPIAVTFLLRGSHFIGLWMGSEYAELSGEVLQVLTLTLIFTGATSVAWAVIFGLGRHKALVPVSVAEGLINLLLSILLVQKLGIVGVAWGTAIPNLCTSLFFWPWYVRRTLGIPKHTFILNGWFLPAVAVLPFAACSYAMERWWPAGNMLQFFLQVAAALPAAILGFWFICVKPADRKTYLNVFVQRMHALLA